MERRRNSAVTHDSRERQLLTEAGKLYRLGSLDQAKKICERVLKRNRGNADAFRLLGLVALKQRRWDAARAAYRKGQTLRPKDPRFKYLLAKVSVAEGRYEDSIGDFNAALRLRPDYQEALGWKAIVLERMGRFDEARTLLEPIVAAGAEDADMAEAWAKLELQEGRHGAAVDVIDRKLAQSKLSPLSRHVLTFLRGKALEKAGTYDEAFAAYEEANTALPVDFDPEAYVAGVDQMIATFTVERLQELPRSQAPSEPAVFVVGMPRSGTTLVEQILDAHPLVHGAGEITTFDDIVSELPALLRSERPYPECASDLTQAVADRLGDRYHLQTSRLARKAARIVNKSLQSYSDLGLIALLQPAAHVIHCRRDPLDNCFSCFASPLMPPRFNYSFDQRHLGVVYRQHDRLMRHWRDVLDLDIMEIGYEQLVAEPERWSRSIISFCGLDWDDRCLRPHASGRFASTLSYDQVRQPIYHSSIGRAARFERHLGALKASLLGEQEGQGTSPTG